ncbi:MAG: preprotein translocase subunit SecD [Methanotrichaceae archaeon]
MSLYSDLTNDRRVMAWAGAVILALILILTPLPGIIHLNHGVNYGLDLEGGSYLQLQLQGALVELNADPQKILEKQFGASSVVQNSNGYVVTVNGIVPSNLPDNLGYSGAKVVARNNVSKITIAESPESVIATFLQKGLGTDVKVVPGSSPVQYEIRTSTTRDAINALLAPVGGSVATGDAAFVDGLTPDTVSLTKNVLDAKLNRLGLKDIKVRVVDNKYILIDLAGIDVSTAQDVVGRPGKFEIRIQTDNNASEHVLYGDAVESVDLPRGDQSGGWGVPFTLSESGAQAFQKEAIDSGATKNPNAHEISMYLDKDQIFSAPLSPELAASLNKVPSRSMVAETGSGDPGSLKAKELYIHLSEGALPVNVKIVGSGQVAAALGSQFKFQMAIAGILALLAVGGMIYWRYRNPRIALPMVATSFSEVIMMLGIWSLAGWQLDLASLAGVIVVIGTGVDQLIIITDELTRGGADAAPVASERSIKERAAVASEKANGADSKVAAPSSKVYLSRLSRAFTIILGAAATTAVAMLPLLYMGFGALTGFALTIIAGVVIGVGVARPAYGRLIGYILSSQ